MVDVFERTDEQFCFAVLRHVDAAFISLQCLFLLFENVVGVGDGKTVALVDDGRLAVLP